MPVYWSTAFTPEGAFDLFSPPMRAETECRAARAGAKTAARARDARLRARGELNFNFRTVFVAKT